MKKIIQKLFLLTIFLTGIANMVHANQAQGITHEKYAVIISGAGNTRYKNDCYAVNQTLLNKGYDQNHIYVAISEGYSQDLDGDGDDENIYPAGFDYLQDIFTWLLNHMTSEDDLFIYVTGPGLIHPLTGQSCIDLYGGYDLSDLGLKFMLAPIEHRTINVVMQQSYSGGFIDALMELDNIVITTACQATEVSHSMARGYFDEFTFRWVSAITGNSPYALINSNACNGPTDLNHYYDPADCIIDTDGGDYNGDGYVTMQEAFNYAERRDKAVPYESPMIDSNPGCLSRALALDELLYSDDCSATLVQGWDLYMKDNSDDYGDEPNISTNECWITNEIWFEENGEKVEVLQSGQTYDFCVQVRNRGAQTSPAGAVLYAHWTKARIGGAWPWGWTGYTYDCNGTPVRQGDLAGYDTLPPIEGGKTYIARIPWTTPESEEYRDCFEFAGDQLNELWHYCVLARIVDSQEQPDETITDMYFQDFVLNFNNVVSRNVTIMGVQNDVNLGSSSSTEVVGLANPLYGEDSGPYTLKCDISGMANWDQVANITLTFPSSFYSSQTAMTSYNCHDNGYGNYDLYDTAHFDDIYFAGNDDNFYPVIVSIDYYNYNPEQYYNFIVSLVLVDGSGVKVGGEDFEFQNYPPGMTNGIRRRDIPVEEGTVIEQQKPILPEDVLYVDIYNAQGQLLTRTTNDNIESLNLSQGIYILRKVGTEMSYSVKIIK